MKRLLLAALVVAAVISVPARAADNDWNFRLTPYLWFAGVKGDASTLPGAPVAPIDVSSGDALSDTEASLMVLFEAKKQKHGVLVDFLYTDVQSDAGVIPAIGLTMKSTSKTTIFSATYLYELHNKDQAVVDMFAGARYWDIDTQLDFSGGLGILAGRSIRHSESWVDPLIGIKGRTPLGRSRFFVAGGVGIGGFGVGSDRFYDMSANIGYQWNKAIGTTLGYRLYDVKYENGTFLYDVTQQGWMLGLTWAF